MYYSLYSFEVIKNNLTKYDIKRCFSIFHNNVRSLNRNLENLQSHLLEEPDFHFDVIGVTETKIPIQIWRDLFKVFLAIILNTFQHPCQLGVLECLLMQLLIISGKKRLLRLTKLFGSK